MKTQTNSTSSARTMSVKTGVRAGITPIPIPRVIRTGTHFSFDGGGGIELPTGTGGYRGFDPGGGI